MSPTTTPTTILLVSKSPSVIDDTRAALIEEDTLNLFEREMNLNNFHQIIAEIQPNMILIDFEFRRQALYLVHKIALVYPMIAVVAILSQTKMNYSDRAVQSGARAFIQHPFAPESLVPTLKQVMAPLGNLQMFSPQPFPLSDNNKPKNTFTVFSPKGGAGTSTIATNLAISLHQSLNEDVLLIDGKHLFGHIALYLNIRTGNSITDLLAHADLLDQRLIKQVVEQHTSGIHVLPSPTSIDAAQEMLPETLFKVIQCLQHVFPNIVIDGGSHLDENAVTYMDTSDKILLVLNPDLASIRDVRQFMEIAATLGYPKDKTLLILNLTGKKIDVKRDEIENILQMNILGKIPADEGLAMSSLNEGVPIVVKKPRHSISKAYAKIATELEKVIQTNQSAVEHENK